MQDKDFYKEFKKCFKGKENAGYAEWSSKVKDKLKEMKNDNLLNMKKRFEWKIYAGNNEEKGWFSNFLQNLSPYVVLIVTVMVSIYTAYQELLSSVEETKSVVMSDINIFRDIFGEWIDSIMNMCFVAFTLMIILVFISYILDLLLKNYNNNRILYYTEMLELINVEYKNRETEVCE